MTAHAEALKQPALAAILQPTTHEELFHAYRDLLAAVKEHHDQRGDDRCFMDDERLYCAAGLEPADRTMPPREEFLANCARFYERRCVAGDWPSYQDLEARVAESTGEIQRLERENELLRAALAVEAQAAHSKGVPQ